ncbi:DUF6233 domain-containing protein [Streptomyces sp. NPDC059740]|uniref:DUF6233 domain-containing protein n=1 Tax=Streptomyces sp. NPDC059740 TaxID=3346926 RepID=UPI00365EC87B
MPGLPGPRRGTRIFSSTGLNWGQSPRRPAASAAPTEPGLQPPRRPAGRAQPLGLARDTEGRLLLHRSDCAAADTFPTWLTGHQAVDALTDPDTALCPTCRPDRALPSRGLP